MTLLVNAQLRDHVGLRLYLINTTYGNNKLPGKETTNHTSIEIDVAKSIFSEKKTQFSYRNRIIGDGIHLAVEAINGGANETAEKPGETNLYSLLIGWANIGWNVIRNENFNLATGFGIHDYWYTAVADDDPLQNIRPEGHIEPSGWYGAIGPALIADAAIGSTGINVHVESTYALSKRFKEARKLREEENYETSSPDPHFVNTQLEIRYGSAFLGFTWVKMLNKYKVTKDFNSGTRFDIMLGFKFRSDYD